MVRVQNIIRHQLPRDFIMIAKGVPVCVNICWYFMPAKAELKRKGFCEDIANDNVPYLKKRGDRDNLDKLMLDSGNQLLWYDDAQVYDGRLTKYYSLNPRTEVEVIWDPK
jgi:Holliday junction resolvase RusA-like endonuclease